MFIDILIISIALLALMFASISDIKTREVPDWLNFSLIAAVIGVRLIYSMTTLDWNYFFYGAGALGIMFVLGNVLYYSKQMGGGDAKLLMGLGAAFATTPYYLEETIPFLAVFLINVLVIGALYGFVWSFVIFFKKYKKTKKELIKQFKKTKTQQIFLMVVVIIMSLSIIFTQDEFYKTMLILTLAFLAAYYYLFMFAKIVEKIAMFKWVEPKELTEGDWIAKDVKINNKLIVGPHCPGIDNKHINQIIKGKVKRVLIKEGMPFVPAIFFATIVTLTIGNVLILFI